MLSDEIGISMNLIKTEAGVGSFSADILAEEPNTGRKIVIENQLEQTDHDHFGKLFTYGSGLDTTYGETDKDCGGSNCPGCSEGDTCSDNSDCKSGYCSDDDECEVALCENGIFDEDNGETATDCGGPCDGCEVGKKCSGNRF